MSSKFIRFVSQSEIHEGGRYPLRSLIAHSLLGYIITIDGLGVIENGKLHLYGVDENAQRRYH